MMTNAVQRKLKKEIRTLAKPVEYPPMMKGIYYWRLTILCPYPGVELHQRITCKHYAGDAIVQNV